MHHHRAAHQRPSTAAERGRMEEAIMIDYTSKPIDAVRIVACRACGMPGLAERERYGASEPVLVAVVHAGEIDPTTMELTSVQRCHLVSDEYRQQNREVAQAEHATLLARCESK